MLPIAIHSSEVTYYSDYFTMSFAYSYGTEEVYRSHDCCLLGRVLASPWIGMSLHLQQLAGDADAARTLGDMLRHADVSTW